MAGKLQDGTTSATYTLDLTAMKSAADGEASFEIGGKTYSIKLEKDDDAEKIATKLVAAYNKDKTTDGLGGSYTASSTGGTVTFTASKNGANATSIIATEALKDSVDTSSSTTISVADAYTKMAEELKAASSIGADTAADVTNNNNGTFTITKGTTTIKEALAFNLHVGADADMTNKIGVNIETMSAAGLGIKDINVTDDTGVAATYAIDAIADAISTVSSQRSALGVVQNRLEHTIDNLDNVVENTTSAESRIRDTDMAEEMVTYSKNSILQQAGQSMLAQANQANQGVLSLLQ